ncbi:hypothetical protein TrLO_g6555 [Triparma laevis f. longispina]|uniref:Uncharacterized protein n=1 Tax=Triparma laevis f. longispina TaxID=1714387 RepID=A0A9W7FCF3_9STRA|nr:hypothetical protein TrLO_g6555 [Triparma laevis f. longispina]
MPVPSHSDTVLASLDVVAALEMTTGDAIMDAKIRALSNLHSQKVRALMKSVNSLKSQISIMKAQSKEHRRSSLITGLRDKFRESELVVDILKTELTIKTGMGVSEVNEFIVKRSLGGPKRFRPKSREELQNELIEVEKKYRRVCEKNKLISAGGENLGRGNVKFKSEIPPPSPAESSPVYGREGGGEVLQGQVSELLDEIESLKVSLNSRDTNLTAQMQEMDRLRSENRELRRIEERLAHKERKHRDLKERNKEMERENSRMVEESEVARADFVQVKAMLETAKEESKIEADALRSQYGKQMDELAGSMAREAELAEQLDRYKGEATANRQTNYELVRTKEITLSETQKLNNDLKMKLQTVELKNEKLEREMSSLQQGAKETAVLKEKLRGESQRSRELARRLKDYETRLEDNIARREKAEAQVTTLKERAKLAESQNSKLHKEIQGITGRMEREESLLKDAMEDKAAIRAAASSEGQIKDLQEKVKELQGKLADSKGDVGDLTKELNGVMNDKEALQKELEGCTEKLVQAEKTRDFALKATKLASQASEVTQSEGGKKVVAELLLQKSTLEDSLAKQAFKVASLEDEREKLVAAVKALKQKNEAAQMLKKKNMLALEAMKKQVEEARSGGLATKEVEEMKMLLRGAEIEREASEQKAALAESEVQSLRQEIEAYDNKLTGAKEKFTLQIKQIEKEVKADLSSGSSDHTELFKSLRQELEAANREAAKQKKAGKNKLKEIQIDLDAHVDAVTLLREMGDKYKSHSQMLMKRLTDAGIEDVPEMPTMSPAVQEHQSEHESESESESVSGSETSSMSGTSTIISATR